MTPVELLKVLDQDEVWLTHDGDPLPLEALSAAQRAAALAWLTERAAPLMELEWAPRHIGGSRALGMAHARALDEVPDAMEWLYDQPLVQRLVALIGDDEEAAS